MSLFKYRAVDAEGKPSEGTMDEFSAERVVSILRERGLQVSSVEPIGKRVGLKPLKTRLTWEDLEVFNRQLLAIAQSGLPLAQSLKAVAQDIHSVRLKRAIDAVQHDVESGLSLEEALERQSEYFPPVYVAMVRAGERAGNLSGVLELLSTYSTRMIEMKNAVGVAVAYPLVVLVCACLVVGFLTVYVVPVFADIFHDFGSRLPAPTRVCLAVCVFLRHHALSLAVALVLIVILLHGLRRVLRWTESGNFFLDSVVLHVPVVRRLFAAASLGRFSRSLGLLLASRAHVLDSMNLAAAAAGNAVLARSVRAAAQRVSDGTKMADALASTGYFPHSFCWLLGVGEDRGEADRALLDIADAYDRDVAGMEKLVKFLLAPVLVVAVGAVIAFVVLSLYLPLFTAGDAIAG